MITKINTDISIQTNKRIISYLFAINNWSFSSDNIQDTAINKKDSGFILNTFVASDNYSNNDILNTYAQVIFDMVEKNTFMKFKKLERVCWNWYHPGSITEFHVDENKDNKFSIIYNLHDNDGGTNFKINKKITFHQSKESVALLFPSKVLHRGVAPKENFNRFCLNMIVEI